MTTGLTYSQYVTQIATMAVVAETDPAFVTILPSMITYAENRMYRDIDFMFTSTSLHGVSFVLTPGNRNLSPRCPLWSRNYKPQFEQSQNEWEWKPQKYGQIRQR